MAYPPLIIDPKNQNIHHGTEHLAINDTFIQRCLTRIALHTTAKFYTREDLCIPISKHKIVKTGHRVRLTEGATLKYVAENTSIPVPKVYCSFLHKDRAYIVMERIQGKVLPEAWEHLSEESLEGIFAQLRKIFQDLRALTPPPGMGVGSCVGGPLYDHRIRHGRIRFGPFQTIQEFHFWSRRGLKLGQLQMHSDNKDWQDLQVMMKRQDGPWPSPKFTHGDLNPFNVLVRGTDVVGLIDWEFSGWYPHYWEYTSAWFGNLARTYWQEVLDKILDPPQPEDLEMDAIRKKWWGDL